MTVSESDGQVRTTTHAGDPFAGPGDVRRLCRELDWAATPLGPVESWSPALRHVVSAVLNSPFPICLWCGSELILIYNDAYIHVLGSKHPEALGRPGTDAWSEIWDQIGPMFQDIREGGPSVFAADAPFHIVRRGEDVTAEPREPNAWFTFSLSPVQSDDGEIVAFLNIVSESTGRVLAERERTAALAQTERAEARLREVFAQAPAFMAVLRGEDHVFEYVNAAFYQLVGHRELVGRPVWEALPEVRGQGFEERLDAVLETGEPYIGREVPVSVSRTPNSDPERRYVDLVYYPITEADGTRSGLVAHGSDVTEHVLARVEAQRARAEAEEANQAKSQFLAMMSHEIRTPINAVIGYTDLLDSGVAGELSERQAGYVERVRTSSRHLLTLVNDILDLAKIEAGEMMVDMHETSLTDVVRAAFDMVAGDAETRELRIERHIDCSDDVHFMGDEDRVRQVLLNLLSNAIKFTEPGGTIVIECGEADQPDDGAETEGDGPWLMIAVEDTGTGIAEDQLLRIFDPFAQVDSGRTRKSGGTGLGLTISRQLARRMGGDLTVRSQPGAVSRFTLWLRRAG